MMFLACEWPAMAGLRQFRIADEAGLIAAAAARRHRGLAAGRPAGPGLPPMDANLSGDPVHGSGPSDPPPTGSAAADPFAVTTLDQLVALYDAPRELVVKKVTHRLEARTLAFIAASP